MPVVPFDVGVHQMQPDLGTRRKERLRAKVEENEETSDKETEPISARTRSKSSLSKEELIAPLRQVVETAPDANGQQVIRSMFQYVPFTTTDLLNWKQHYGPFSKKPAEIIDLFNTIFQTHNPTWRDIQQLFNTLLNMEDKEKKIKMAKNKILRQRFPNDNQNQDREGEAVEQEPNWDPNNAAHMTLLNQNRQLCLEVLREAAKGPVNFTKPSTVLQEKEETIQS